MTVENATREDFKLTFEVAIIEHLGLNLYSEVHSAISELIANAYDAESTEVAVTLPISVSLGLEGQRITISDNGVGMTYEECRDRYLRIGLNRRTISRRSKNNKRHVIGKKGIGKLAGFGIADQVHIHTVSDSKETEFILNLDAIRSSPPVDGFEQANSALPSSSDSGGNQGLSQTAHSPIPDGADVVREYHPVLLRIDEPTSKPSGTTVILERIRPLDAIDRIDFETRLSRKFAIFAHDFVVMVIDSNSRVESTIDKFSLPTQFRFPDDGWGADAVRTVTMGQQPVKYWIGFTKSTIKDDAIRGISVISNGKSVQEPFDFKLSGGVEGQFGLQYMTGEVVADWLDEHAVDVVASDRASVRWSDLDAQRLLEWGRAKVKECLREWAKRRAAKTIEEITRDDASIRQQIESYKGAARQELEQVVDRVVALISHLGEERIRDIVQSIVLAYRHEHIRTVLNQIIAGKGGYDLFVEALHEWDLIDAVLTFQELSVKLSAIQTLAALIMGGATETKSKAGTLSLHEHLAEHPWLIYPMFSEMQHERNIDKFILEQYNVDPESDDKRFDFVLLYDSERIRIVEIKSAKDKLDERGTNNLTLYHFRIKQQELKRHSRDRRLRSILIYNGKATLQAEAALNGLDRSEFEVYEWSELLRRNMRIYKEQLQHVRAKNPTDPRIVSLWEVMQERLAAVAQEPTPGAAG